MYYRFIIEAWTNDPIEIEVELQKAIDLHEPLFGMNMQVTAHELATGISADQVGENADGDPWRFFIEGETRQPTWSGGEIETAIRNYELTANMGLELRPEFVLMASPDEREQTVDDVERWLRENQRQQGKRPPEQPT